MTKTKMTVKTCPVSRSFTVSAINRKLTSLDDFMVAGGDDDDRDSRRAHAQLDNRREAIDERSNEEIAQALKGRYAGQAQVRYTGDMNEIPQRLLMPSVHDASLWQVRVKVSVSTCQ
jgi:hypothetical protein